MAAQMASVSGKKLSPVLLITHKACSEHLIKGHPEQPRRVASIVRALVSSFNREEMTIDENPPRVTKAQLLRFHTEGHVSKLFKAFEKVEKNKKNKEMHIDEDTSVMRATPEACFRAAGGAVHAVDCLLGDNPVAKSCFVAVRPPGHHAEPDRAMGFCFFGNAGIAALHAREVYGMTRIAILDWDVHHGNGTQAKFETDPDTFFASSHQMPCYPGTGSPSETGVSGNVVNCALPPGSGSAHFRAAWKDTIIPKLRQFKPQFVIVSAGFDAHGDDPLAELQLVDEDFYYVQSLILGAVPGVPLISMLEGGYNLDAIARSAVQCVRAQVNAFTDQAEAEAEQVTDQAEVEAEQVTDQVEVEADKVTELISQLDLSDSGGGTSCEGVIDVASDPLPVKSLLAQIYEGYAVCLSSGVIRSNPTSTLHRVLPGSLSLKVTFDALHFAAKRPTQLVAVDMRQPFDKHKFNFNKANPIETIATVKSTSSFATSVLQLLDTKVDSVSDYDHPVLVNVSPLMRGHCVVALWCEEGQSQLLNTPLQLAAACEIALASGPTCRVGFNSLGAFASINHLHVHIMPVDAGFPLDRAPIKECLFSCSSVSVGILEWCVPCFSFQGEDAAVVVAMTHLLVSMLVTDAVPYNVLIASAQNSVRFIVIPRRPQEEFDPFQEGFNAAVCELSGFLIANSQDKFDRLTQDSVIESFSNYAALDSSQVTGYRDRLMTALSSKHKLYSYTL